MKRKWFNSLFFLAALFLVLSCSKLGVKNNMEVERRSVVSAIHSSIGWAANKDTALLYSIIASDSNFLEVHPSTRVVRGINQFKQAESFWLNPNFRAVSYSITNLKVTFSQNGDVAWFFCMLDDVNEWKGEPANWENTRWTGVLEKRNGSWRMVQQHFSFAQE